MLTLLLPVILHTIHGKLSGSGNYITSLDKNIVSLLTKQIRQSTELEEQIEELGTHSLAQHQLSTFILSSPDDVIINLNSMTLNAMCRCFQVAYYKW
jgi:hypothetical protein